MPIAAAFGQNVQPNAGAQLFFFVTGTTTPKPTFADASETVPNPDPVVADARGRFPAIFLSGLYDVVLQDANDVQIWEAEELFNPSPAAAGVTFKGGFDASTNAGDYPAEGDLGDLYVVTTGFTLNPASGSHVLETGDFIIANTNGATGIDADWSIIKGEQGASLSDIYIRPWAATRNYSIDDYAGATDGKIYIAKVAQSNNDPAGGGDTTNWKPFGEIINDLISTDATRSLGADQGKILKDVQDTLVAAVIPGTETVQGLNLLFKRIILSAGADADHDIDFAAGSFRFNDGSRMAALSAITKQLDVVWATGTNAGGLPATVTKTGSYSTTGTTVDGVSSAFDTDFKIGDVIFSTVENIARRIVSISTPILMEIESAFLSDVGTESTKKNGEAPRTTYHCFALSNDDADSIDAGFDTDINAVNLLADVNVVAAGLTKFSLIESRLTDDSDNFIPMLQIGRRSEFITRIFDVDTGGSLGTSAILFELSTPIGRKVRLQVTVGFVDNTGISMLISDPDTTDIVPGDGLETLRSMGTDERPLVTMDVVTNLFSQVRYRATSNNISDLTITTIAWVADDLEE